MSERRGREESQCHTRFMYEGQIPYSVVHLQLQLLHMTLYCKIIDCITVRYTWFSLEALDENWQSLQKISRVSHTFCIHTYIHT